MKPSLNSFGPLSKTAPRQRAAEQDVERHPASGPAANGRVLAGQDWFFIYTVTKNGAAWKSLDRLSDALGYVEALSNSLHKSGCYQGFDESGKSAVVVRPAVVEIEVNVYRGSEWNRRHYERVAVDRRWVDGVEVDVESEPRRRA